MALVSSADYCAYSHFASILRRAGTEWLIAVYETYFDDSGTNAESEIAIAACYVSTEPAWKRFVGEWDAARFEEGFDVFHMAEFVAPRAQGHKPWCEWDNVKKDRVYKRLATIINDHKRVGIAAAVPKTVYDKVPDRVRQHYGFEHYTFAVRSCLMKIWEWREKSLITHPMQYIFDWEKPGSLKHTEISNLLGGVHPKLQPLFGLDTGGYSFQRRAAFKPLQAADILAWQMNSFMPKIYPQGESWETIDSVLHPGFRILREDQEMDLGFFTEHNLGQWLQKIEKYEAEHGVIF